MLFLNRLQSPGQPEADLEKAEAADFSGLVAAEDSVLC